MLSLKSLVTASAAITLLSGVSAGPVVVRNSSPSLPSCSSYTPYKYAGCFAESSLPTTTLIFRTNLDSQNMTVEICTAYCKGNLYQYAGLEYYGQCFCGASVNGPQVDKSFCTYPCTGDKTETCGGTDYISIYQDPTYPIDDTTVISDYQSMGCYTDLTSTGRTLEWPQSQLDASTMTVETCLFACKKGGYSFAGVEYGSQCFCGVVLGNGTTQVDSSQCNMACNGNAAEKCGAGALLNLYVATDIESTEPCSGGSPPSSSSSSRSSTTSTRSSTSSTTSPITTTTGTSTTATVKLCTATATVTPAPTCEYKCGNWCSTPIPDFTDAKGCATAASACAVQVASCFLHAGFPESLKCFDFAGWCANIGSFGKNYCPGGSCSRPSCKSKYPPTGPAPSVSVSTSVFTCSATATSTKATSTSTSTSSSCIPVPTTSNICVQPNSPGKGYSPGSPVGGIALPCLTCNNVFSDYSSNPFKLYTDADSKKCNSYKPDKNSIIKACQDACDSQYASCMSTYSQSCKKNNGGGGHDTYSRAENNDGEDGQDTYSQAKNKCQNQHSDCYKANSGASGSGRCGSWNNGWK